MAIRTILGVVIDPPELQQGRRAYRAAVLPESAECQNVRLSSAWRPRGPRATAGHAQRLAVAVERTVGTLFPGGPGWDPEAEHERPGWDDWRNDLI